VPIAVLKVAIAKTARYVIGAADTRQGG